MLDTTILGKYQIKKQTRENELFIEYQGRDVQSGKNIVVVVIRANIIPASEFLSRFESLSQVKNEHIPALIEIGEVDGQAVLIHENIEGKSLADAEEFIGQLENIRNGLTALSPSNAIGMEDSLVGQTLGGYRLVGRLGQGGMATVYKAYEPALDRYVAIKVLPQFFANDPVFVQRFKREAKAVAQLNHPNIVPIYSFGETNNITYIAMQFVMGDTLKHDDQKFGFDESLRLLAPIARALGYAHQRGIVHRDIKPSNILLTDGNWPLLADFGLAQMAQTSGKLTESGVGMGTPMYMSPEQGQGEKVDQRTDIYSLGIVLYELVTGDVPFRADTPMAIVIKHISAPMPMPRQVNANIPDYLEAVILKATAKNPDDRYQTAEEMALAMENALTRILSNAPTAARIQPAAQKISAVESKPAAQADARPSTLKKILRAVIFSIVGIISAALAGIALMAILDICPPSGVWQMPLRCESAQTQLPVVKPTTAQTSEPAHTEEPTLEPAVETGMVLDDFETASFEGRSGWEAYSEDGKDTELDCYVDDSKELRDSNYLNFEFDVAENSWATCGFYFDEAQDWRAGQGVAFYLRSDQPNAEYQIELFGGTPDAQTTYVYWTETPPESVDDWVRIEIPWTEILRADWEEDPGTVFDPASVTGFVVSISTNEDARQSGVLWVDDLSLFGEAQVNPNQDASVFFDDFENLDRIDIESYFLEESDTTTDCTLDETTAFESSTSLRFDFDVAPDAWASCGSSLAESLDWQEGSGIAFYVHADQPDLLYAFSIIITPNGKDETYIYETATTPESVEGWERVEFYWDDITRVSWEDNSGTPITPEAVEGFWFEVSAPQDERESGVIWIDHFEVMP